MNKLMSRSSQKMATTMEAVLWIFDKQKMLQLRGQFEPEVVSNFLLSYAQITTSTAFHLVCPRWRHMVRKLKRFMKKGIHEFFLLFCNQFAHPGLSSTSVDDSIMKRNVHAMLHSRSHYFGWFTALILSFQGGTKLKKLGHIFHLLL